MLLAVFSELLQVEYSEIEMGKHSDTLWLGSEENVSCLQTYLVIGRETK